MKAIAVTPTAREIAWIDVEPPALATPTDVALRMLDVGVCGTDREIAAFQYGTPPPGRDRLVIGHESLGEVIEIGAAVTRVRPGDLVVPMVRRPCPHPECAACRAGRQDFCYTGDFTERGIRGRDGFMTERVVDDERYMHVVPRALREFGVLVEPLTIAEKALLQVEDVQRRLPWVCPIEPGSPAHGCHRAVVLGAGPVGLLGAMALVAAGFQTTVYSREEPPNPKADVATAIGARYVAASSTSLDRLVEAVGPIDLVYEATGASKAAFDMMRVLGPNGVFVFTGVPGRRGPVEVDTDLLMKNMVLQNQAIVGTVNAGPDAFEAAIRHLDVFHARWPQALAALITSRHPPQAYRELLTGPSRGIKNVLRFA